MTSPNRTAEILFILILAIAGCGDRPDNSLGPLVRDSVIARGHDVAVYHEIRLRVPRGAERNRDQPLSRHWSWALEHAGGLSVTIDLDNLGSSRGDAPDHDPHAPCSTSELVLRLPAVPGEQGLCFDGMFHHVVRVVPVAGGPLRCDVRWSREWDGEATRAAAWAICASVTVKSYTPSLEPTVREVFELEDLEGQTVFDVEILIPEHFKASARPYERWFRRAPFDSSDDLDVAVMLPDRKPRPWQDPACEDGGVRLALRQLPDGHMEACTWKEHPTVLVWRFVHIAGRRILCTGAVGDPEHLDTLLGICGSMKVTARLLRRSSRTKP